MIDPFGDDDMERWAALDVDDRAAYDLMLDEMHATGFDTTLAHWDVQILHSVIAAFTTHHNQSATAALVCQALLTTWHRVHPDVSWMVHAQPAEYRP